MTHVQCVLVDRDKGRSNDSPATPDHHMLCDKHQWCTLHIYQFAHLKENRVEAVSRRMMNICSVQCTSTYIDTDTNKSSESSNSTLLFYVRCGECTVFPFTHSICLPSILLAKYCVCVCVCTVRVSAFS